MHLLRLVALCVALLTQAVHSGVRPKWADVVLVGGAYKNVLVAISRDVPEDSELIEDIKTLFRGASRELAVATGGRVRFGHVDILVPASWNHKRTRATVQRFDNADFIVAPPKPIHRDAPYTKRVGGCGKRGEFVHITPKYVKDSTYASRWGPPSKALVHEWAHYWWGVFDEYPTPNKQYYTGPSGRPAPVMCPADFPGDWLTAPGGRPCEAGAPGCKFIPRDPPQTGPSFMTFYHLPNVTTFCNESGEHPHNVFAPTKHNKMCNRRSVWSVIQQHADFRASPTVLGSKAAPTTSPVPNIVYPGSNSFPKEPHKVNGGRSDTTMTFQVLKRSERVLFVLDKNMKASHQRLMVGAFQEFIARAESDSEVAVVSFGYSTKLTRDMPWSTIANIRNLSTTVDSSNTPCNNCSSCIGDALFGSLQFIDKMEGKRAGAVIVLLTPARQALSRDANCREGLTTSLVRLVQQHVTLHVVFTEDGAAPYAIQPTVEATYGRSLKLSSIRENAESAFLRLLEPTEDNRQAKIQLVKKRDSAKSEGDAVSGHVYVDSSCGQELLFRFGQLDMQRTYDVTVRSPSGLDYTNSKVDGDSATITVEVNETEVGMWGYTVNSDDTNSTLTVQTSLECEPSSDAVDIQVTPQMNLNRVNFADAGSEYLILAAQVTADGLPVQHVTVVASVTLGNGSTLDVRLSDNGAGADTDGGDGLYSAYFVHYAGNGSYSVDIAAERTKSSSTNGQASPHGAFDAYQNQTSTMATNATVPSFQRTAASPPFTVENLPPGEVDLFPPATVTDLDFEVASFDIRTIKLKFTAQGDDLDSGTASSYDIRYVALTDGSGAAERLEQLRNNFNSCSVLAFSGTPLEAGKTESMILELSDNNDVQLFMVALKVVDDSSQSSDVSNIVVVNFRRLTTTTSTTTTSTISSPVTSVTPATGLASIFKGTSPLQLTLVQLILIVVAAVVVMTLIFICVLCIVLRCKRSGSTQNRNGSCADVELQDRATMATTRTDDLKPQDNMYENAHDVSHDTSREKSFVNSGFAPRPEPVGQSDTRHVERRHVGAWKRISRLMSPVSPVKANLRASGSYATSIEPASDSPPAISNYSPSSGDFTHRIGPDGGEPGTSILYPRTPTRTPVSSPVVTTATAHSPNPARTYAKAPPLTPTYARRPPNPKGINAKTPPIPPPKPTGTYATSPPVDPNGIYANIPSANPTGTYARTPQPDQGGICVNLPSSDPTGTYARAPPSNATGTHQRTLTPTPENDASSDESTYDDGHTWRRGHPDDVSRISSSSSDYQDTVGPTPGTTPVCIRRAPIGADNVAHTPASTTGVCPDPPRSNTSRKSWAIDRSSFYQEIGADETSAHRPAEGAPNFGAFAHDRFQQPSSAARQPLPPFLVSRLK